MKELDIPEFLKSDPNENYGRWKEIVEEVRAKTDYNVGSFHDLVVARNYIPEAMEILIENLWNEQDPHIVAGLCRALLDARYSPLIKVNRLIEKYKSFQDTWVRNNPNGGKGTMAHLISRMIDKDDLDKIYDVFLNDDSLGDTRVWFLDVLNKYKANQKFYDYLVSHKDEYTTTDEIEIYEGEVTKMKNKELGLVINRILSSKKWKKFAEENAK